MAPRSFFARLAPWATQQPGAVHAVVAPRFALSDSPAVIPSEASEPFVVEEERAVPQSVGTPNRTTPARQVTPPKQPTDKTAVTPPRRTGVLRRFAPQDDGGRERDATRAVFTAAVLSTHEKHTRVEHPTVVERMTVLEQATPRREPQELTTTVVAQGPLRPQVVAQRTMPPRAESPTVVEITIDRIDVRMPPAANVTQARPAAKRAAPTQSLAEYLRERGPGGA